MFGSEKRQHRRAPASIDVDYKVGEITGKCIATDISQNGIFLNINPAPEIGSRVYLSFVLPGYSKLPPLKIVGKVVRIVNAGEGQLPGVGVEFDLIYAESRETIRSFIRKILGPTVVISKQKDAFVKGRHYRLDYKNIAQKGPFETEATGEDEKNISEFKSLKIRGTDPARIALILKISFFIIFAGILGYGLYILAKYLLM
ncbi:MAG: PilZ domain-containing protein [Deltaproteobacteria bacterium]|nr:PilZ domain-containing protein [Deltaproteobacteria bacterium]